MIFPRLPINAQRSTLELPNVRISELSRAGMTLIELVAALALFVIILGSLLVLLNSATTLWTSSRSQQRELPVAQNTIEMLAEDLQQAVTDNRTVSNSTANAATFLLDSRPEQLEASGVSVLLQFVRQTASPSLTETGTGVPLSLEAVFYTFFENALYRHVVPLYYTSYNPPESLNELLETARQKVKAFDHTKIRDFSTKGSVDPSLLPKWSCTLLAERVVGLGLIAALPKRYEPKATEMHSVRDETTNPSGVLLPAEYDYLELNVLPDRIDAYIELLDKEHWNAIQNTPDSGKKQTIQDQFGIRVSQRITFPALGGSRLP